MTRRSLGATIREQAPMSRAMREGLTELCAGNLGVTHIQGMEDFPSVEVLYINGNNVKQLTGLKANYRLQLIEASDNAITTLEGSDLTSLSNLQELRLSNNHLCDLKAQCKVLSFLPCLRNVQLKGNPCFNEADARFYIIAMVPQLETIDRASITPQERREAEKKALEQGWKALGSDESSNPGKRLHLAFNQRHAPPRFKRWRGPIQSAVEKDLWEHNARISKVRRRRQARWDREGVDDYGTSFMSSGDMDQAEHAGDHTHKEMFKAEFARTMLSLDAKMPGKTPSPRSDFLGYQSWAECQVPRSYSTSPVVGRLDPLEASGTIQQRLLQSRQRSRIATRQSRRSATRSLPSKEVLSLNEAGRARPPQISISHSITYNEELFSSFNRIKALEETNKRLGQLRISPSKGATRRANAVVEIGV